MGPVTLLESSQEFAASDQVPAEGDQTAFVMVAQEAIVAYPDKSFWRDMHQEAAHKFYPIQGVLLPYTTILIILHTDSHRLLIHPEDTAVADCDTVCITPQLMHNGFRPCEGLPDIGNPVFIVTGIQQFLIRIAVAVFIRPAFITESACIVELFQPG